MVQYLKPRFRAPKEYWLKAKLDDFLKKWSIQECWTVLCNFEKSSIWPKIQKWFFFCKKKKNLCLIFGHIQLIFLFRGFGYPRNFWIILVPPSQCITYPGGPGNKCGGTYNGHLIYFPTCCFVLKLFPHSSNVKDISQPTLLLLPPQKVGNRFSSSVALFISVLSANKLFPFC